MQKEKRNLLLRATKTLVKPSKTSHPLLRLPFCNDEYKTTQSQQAQQRLTFCNTYISDPVPGQIFFGTGSYRRFFCHAAVPDGAQAATAV